MKLKVWNGQEWIHPTVKYIEGTTFAWALKYKAKMYIEGRWITIRELLKEED